MQEIIHTENLGYLQAQPDNRFDFAVLDPPYGLGKITDISGLVTEWLSGGTGLDQQTKGFMNKAWDVLPAPVFWKELLRTIKPGGHIAVFAGSRTVDMMGLSMRLGGWEIRNSFAWLYATGFKKGLDVSKALDAKQGATREVIDTIKRPHISGANGNEGWQRPSHYDSNGQLKRTMEITAPATELAQLYDGYGTDLKPAYEPIILARKPFRGTVAENVMLWGTGSINLAACKVASNDYTMSPEGRFPPNVLFSHSLWCVEGAECAPDCPVAALDRQSGDRPSGKSNGFLKPFGGQTTGKFNYNYQGKGCEKSKGGASRFYPNFYYSEEDLYFAFRFIAKSSRGERNKGLSDLPKQLKVYNGKSAVASKDMKGVERNHSSEHENFHPTVKPVAIMRWLCELLAPPALNGIVPIGIDPFVGSGTAALAAYDLGLRFVGLEQDADYVAIATHRLAAAKQQMRLEDYLATLAIDGKALEEVS